MRRKVYGFARRWVYYGIVLGASQATQRLTGPVLRLLPLPILLAGHFVYVHRVYRLLVFHASDIRKHVPDVAKFLRVVGVEEFVLRDQSLPCRLSHPGSGCAANALRLSVIFWWRLFPSLVTTRVLWSIARGQRGRIDVFALLRFSAFLFFTCSVPGYIFCLTKRGGRAGSEAGVALSAFAGAMALNVLPLEQRSALINRYCLALTLLWLF